LFLDFWDVVAQFLNVRLMPRYIFIALLVVGICCGIIWAVHPILYPPQGLMPSDWTYVQLIQDRYSFHLVAPKLVSGETQWMFAEAFTRFCTIVIGVGCIYISFTRHEKPVA
jgi:hypothetical protein